MDFTKTANPSAELDFTKPAARRTQPEAEEQRDFSQPANLNAEPTPEAEDEERPKRKRRKRQRNTEPPPTSHIRTINTAEWKQQQADRFKRAYLGGWG
ncbi:hypothetical protein [Glutamicibacter sp. BSL13]